MKCTNNKNMKRKDIMNDINVQWSMKSLFPLFEQEI